MDHFIASLKGSFLGLISQHKNLLVPMICVSPFYGFVLLSSSVSLSLWLAALEISGEKQGLLTPFPAFPLLLPTR